MPEGFRNESRKESQEEPEGNPIKTFPKKPFPANVEIIAKRKGGKNINDKKAVIVIVKLLDKSLEETRH